LRARAAETEKTQPAAYKSFLADQAAKRAELEQDPTHKGQAKKILLRIFDDEESHLERFKDCFNETTPEDWGINPTAPPETGG
jgi:rubrerythrin